MTPTHTDRLSRGSPVATTMPALGTKLIGTLTKERLKKGGALAIGYALGYLSHASGLF